MNAVLRRRLEMAVRVRDFLRAHKTEAVGDGTALAHFEELVVRAETLAGQQRAGVVANEGRPSRRAFFCLCTFRRHRRDAPGCTEGGAMSAALLSLRAPSP